MGATEAKKMPERFMFTSESVNEGHPDKLADQESDAVVDACFAQDPDSHVACETCTGTGFVMVFGEITTKAVVDYEQIVRDTVQGIGFDAVEKGLDYKTCEVINKLHSQSAEIANCVHAKQQTPEEIGAGDQGHMFGYATDETKDPSKVDRSAAYYCRWIAKSLVAAKLCERCIVQVSYAIGVPHPLSVYVDAYGSGVDGKTNADLLAIVNANFDMRAGMLVASSTCLMLVPTVTSTRKQPVMDTSVTLLAQRTRISPGRSQSHSLSKRSYRVGALSQLHFFPK